MFSIVQHSTSTARSNEPTTRLLEPGSAESKHQGSEAVISSYGLVDTLHIAKTILLDIVSQNRVILGKRFKREYERRTTNLCRVKGKCPYIGADIHNYVAGVDAITKIVVFTIGPYLVDHVEI